MSKPVLSDFSVDVVLDGTTVGTPQLLDSDVTLVDTEGDFDGGTLQVAGLLATDRVSLRNVGTGAGQIGFDGTTITYGGVVIGTATGGIGSAFIVTFNANATTAAVEAVVENLTFQNTDSSPDTTRTLTLDITDAAGSSSRDAFVELTGSSNPFDGVVLGTYTRPDLYDIDGDGDLDAIVGVQTGDIHYFENTGSASAPVYVERTGVANPFDAITPGGSAAPRLADLDGDGDGDLIVGNIDGTVKYYLNTGTSSAPVFTEQTGSANPFDGINVGSYSILDLADLDADGDLDAVFGESGGTLLYYENTGNNTTPAFTQRTGTSNPFDGLDFGSLSSPAFGDVDGDGDIDVVIGRAFGTFHYLENTGTANSAVYVERTGSLNPFDGYDIGSYSRLTLDDIDNDGDLDLIAGAEDGTLSVFENTESGGTIDVTINQPATISISPTLTTIAEDSSTASAVKVADILISDDGEGSNTLSLTGTDATSFEIIGTELFLKAGTALDFETKTSFDVTVQVDDVTVGSTPDDTANYTLTVGDINEAPTAVTLTNVVSTVDENTVGAKIADIVITDDALGTNNLTVIGADAAQFEIVGTELRLRTDATLDFETQTTYDVAVQVDDTGVGGTPDATSATHTLTVTDVNETPTVSLVNVTSNIDENTSTAVAIKIADIITTDDALGSNSLSLAGADAAFFEIVGTELFLKAGTTLDFEAKSSFSVTVQVDDGTVGGTPDDSVNLTLNVNDVNEAPTAVSLANVVTTIGENTVGAKIADIVITDDALGTNTLSLIGADAAQFEIVGTELRLRGDATLDFESQTTYDVAVQLDDASVGGTPDATSSTHTLTVTDVNEGADVSLNVILNNLDENTVIASDLKVADIIVSDDALGTNTLSLNGSSASLYTIVGNELFLKAGTVLDYEDDSFLFVRVRVDDPGVAGDPDDSVNFGISLNDINEAPTAVSVANANINENTSTASRVKVADIFITDDALGTNTLTLSGADAADFEIIGTELFVKAGTVLDFETKSSYNVTISVDDGTVGGNPDATTNFTLTVDDVNEEPTAVTLTNVVSSVAENTVSTKIADIIVTDDALGTNDLIVVGADAAHFEVIGTELHIRADADLNFEAQTTYDVAVAVDDTGVGGTPDATSSTHTLTVTDVNEAPDIVLSNTVTNIDENTSTASAIKIADVAFNDDALGSFTPSLGGADAGHFELIGNELFLKAGTVLDFESQSSYQVTIQTDDATIAGNPDSTYNFTLNVNDVNEAPTDVSLANVVSLIAENSVGTKIADIIITDDALGTNNLTLVGADAAQFEIVGTELRLRTDATLDFESQTTYDVAVQLDDPGVGATPDDTTPTHTLTVFDVNEPPYLVSLSSSSTSVAEMSDTSSAIFLADITVDDDALGSYTLSLSGADAAYFELVGTQLFFSAGTELDFEWQSSYVVSVDADDSSVGGTPDASAIYTFNLSNVVETPSLLGIDGPYVYDENLVNSTPQLMDTEVNFKSDNVYAGGTMTVTGLLADDIVSIRNEGTGFREVGFDGTNITYSGVVIGTASGGIGDTFSIAFNSNATAPAVDHIIENLTYQNSSDNPNFSRTFDITVTDGNGDSTSSASGFIARVGTMNPFDTFNVGYSSMPMLADIDGDGDLDAISGGQYGDIAYYENTGTTTSPTFVEQTGASSPFDGINVGYQSAPQLIDLDGDGDLDLVIGQTYGEFKYFENTGTTTSPTFVQQTGTANPFDGLDGGDQVTPTFADIDNDGDLDMVSGETSGTLKYYQNTGSSSTPAFTEQTGASNPFDGFDVGYRSTPVLADIDGDGDYDLVVGEDYGTLRYFQNTGTVSAPVFAEQTGTANPFDGIDIGYNSAPTFADIDGDGDLDLISGDSYGDIHYYENASSATVNLAVHVNAENDAPSDVTLSNTTTTLDENTSTASAIHIADISFVDDLEGLAILALTGTDAAFFEIVGNQLFLKAGTVLDFESQPSYDVAITVDDPAVGGTPDDTSSTLTLTITDLNEAPSSVTLINTTVSLSEETSTATAIKVADIVVSDDGNGTNVLGLTGADASVFEIVGTELFLKAGTVIDYETQNSYNVAVTVDDTTVGGTPDATSATYTLFVTDDNQIATDVTLTNTLNSIAEDASTATAIKVADINVIDDGEGTHQFSLTGADAALFEVVGTELFLKAGVSLDFEGDAALEVAVEADDVTVGGTPDVTSLVHTLTVTDVNEAATGVSLTNVTASIDEDASTASATKIADIVVTDDALGTNALSLSGTDAASFHLVGAELFLNAGVALDFEAQSSFDVTVVVDDSSVGGTPDVTTNFSLAIGDINEAPTAATLSNLLPDLLEDVSTASRIKVADLTISDDALGTNVISLVGADASSFEVLGNELYLKAGTVLDFETKTSFTVSVEVDDIMVGGTPDASSIVYTLDILDANDAPTAVSIINTTASLAENTSTASAIKVADITVTDDALGTNTLGVTGADAALFEVIGTELYLKAGAVLDFETNPTLDVAVTVDDTAVGSTPDATSSTYSLTITDTNDAPTGIVVSNALNEIVENADTSSPIKVADLTVTDDVLGNNLLSVSGADAALFEIVGTELFLKAGASLNFETNPELNITIEVDDPVVGTSPDATTNFSLPVVDANDAPTDVTLTNVVSNLAEDTSTASAIKIADIVVTDDAIGTNTLSLTGADAAHFEIVGTELFLKAGTSLDFETKSNYDVAVNVDDVTVGSTPDATSSTHSLAITDVNDAPSAVTLINTSTGLLEDISTASRIKVADIVVTDDALGSNTLAVTGADAASFEIIGTELFLKAGTALDYETKPFLDVAVTVDDTSVGGTPDATSATFSLAILDANDPPTSVSFFNTTPEVPEDADTSSAITVAHIDVDDDPQGNNITTLSGPDAALFEIVGIKLNLKAGVVLDFETKPVLEVTVVADDPGVGGTPDATATFFLTVTDANEAPTAVSLTNVVSSLAEDTSTAAAIKIADIVITDDALGSNTLSVTGTDAADFEVIGTELFLKAGTSLDFETKASFDVAVVVDDTSVGGTPDATSATTTLTITDVNDAPTAVALTNTTASLAEDVSTATRIKIADIVVTDDALGTNTLSLSGADAASFEIDGTELFLKAGTALDFETNPDLEVVVSVDDPSVGGTPDASTTTYTLAITDANDAPTAVALSNMVSEIAENADTSSPIKVADISVTDDGLGTNVLSISGDDASLFEIVGTELFLKAGAVLSFASNPSLDITVEVDDGTVGGTPDATTPFNMTVTDTNDAPTAVTLTNVLTSLAEDASTASAIKIADIVVTDDAIGTNTLGLTGADATHFEIIGTELFLKAGTSLDFETKSSFEVAVTADDITVGGTPDATSATNTLTITDANDAPTAVSLSNTLSEIAENADTSSAIKVADIIVTDDALGTNTLSLAGVDASLFEIVGSELFLKAGADLNFATNPTLDVTVHVDDGTVGGSPDATTAYALTVTNTNDAPTAVMLTNAVTSLSENASTASAIKIADIVITDDGLGVNTLALTGADAAHFEIVGTELFLKAGTVLDFETKASYDVAVTVDDVSIGGTPDATSSTFTLAITDGNDAPTALTVTGIVPDLSEITSTASAVKVADIAITDDGLGTNVLSLAGVDAAHFEIIGNELFLKAGTSLDFETKSSYDVTVQVDDASIGGSVDASDTFTLVISDHEDNFTGTPDNDTHIDSTDEEGTLTGLAGDDILRGQGGDDVISGGDGADDLRGGTGSDTINGDGDADVLWGDSAGGAGGVGDADDTLNGGDGDDYLYGEGGDDNLNGDAGNDRLYGSTGADTLAGGAGADIAYGEDGDDTIWGDFAGGSGTGAGNDILLGGAGNDTINGEDGDDIIYGEADDDVLSGGNGIDTFRGGTGLDTLNGDAGDDVLWGDNAGTTGGVGDAADTINGGAGNDFIYGEGGDDELHGGDDNDRLYGALGLDTIYGGAGDDIGYGDEGDDTMWGDFGGTPTGVEGNDILIGGTGNDIMHGEGGDDILHGQDDDDMLYGADGNDELRGGNGSDYLEGGLGIDRLRGEAGTDTLVGGDGNDSLVAGAGADSLDGGEGADDLWGDSAGADGGVGDGADVLNAGAGNDVLHGEGGNDTLNADAGDDRLYGGTGDDIMSAGAGADISYGEDGADTMTGGAGDDYLFGQAGNDDLRGEDDNDRLYGGDGADFIMGGAGADVAYGEADADVIWGDFAGGAGTGAGDDVLVGGAGDDYLYGEDGNDVLLAGADNDRLYGGNGADNLRGDTGSDIVYGGNDNDLLRGEDDNDFLYGEAGFDSLIGGAHDDILDGGDGNDDLWGDFAAGTITGPEGADQLTGGNGEDVLHGEGGDDILDGGADADRLYGGSGADQVTGGTGDDYLYGEDGNDTLLAGDGADWLIGDAGTDVLDGGADNDVLWGGDGDDTITGGTGYDWFWFRGSFGRDTITDYSTGELLDVRTTGVTYGDLQFTNVAGNLEISATAWGAGNVIVLEGVTDTSIAESSFIF